MYFLTKGVCPLEEDVEEQNQQDELKVCPLCSTVPRVLRASPAVYVTSYRFHAALHAL